MSNTQTSLSNDLIDTPLGDYKNPEDLIGANVLKKQLIKALLKRALQAEMTEHLDHNKNQLVANDTGNTRNGKSKANRLQSSNRWDAMQNEDMHTLTLRLEL